MSSEPSPRSRRDRPAKPALSREAIVDAALAIVREEGIDALTMRHLAQALDTGPASLYVYVANRDELWELLFDAALATLRQSRPIRSAGVSSCMSSRRGSSR